MILPLHGCSPVNLLYIFRTPLPKNTSKWLILKVAKKKKQPSELFYKNRCFRVSGKHLCWSLFFIKLQVNFIKETPTQVFSSEFCEIFKSIIFKNNSGRLLQQKIHFWKVALVFQLIFIWKRDLFISKLSETWNQFSKTVISVYIKAILCGVRSYHVEFIIKNIMVLRYSFLFWRNR